MPPPPQPTLEAHLDGIEHGSRRADLLARSGGVRAETHAPSLGAARPEARIGRAKALLREGSLTISEIALKTGFATPSLHGVPARHERDPASVSRRGALAAPEVKEPVSLARGTNPASSSVKADVYAHRAPRLRPGGRAGRSG